MKQDIVLSTYYKAFKEQCSARKEKAVKELKESIRLLKLQEDIVFIDALDIEEWLKIRLEDKVDYENDYDYDNLAELAKAEHARTNDVLKTKKKALNNLIVLCIYVARARKCKHDLERITKESKMAYSEWLTYVYRYYLQVQKEIIDGNGYSYGKTMGCISVHRIHNKPGKSFLGRIDYRATKARKEELIEQGLRPYDKEEAAACAANRTIYDGIDYRVYLNEDYFYNLTLEGHTFTNYKKICFNVIHFI